VFKLRRLMVMDARRSWMALISAEPLQHSRSACLLVHLY